MVSLDPAHHCPHIGPTGGGACIPREYTAETMQNFFNYSFVADQNAKGVNHTSSITQAQSAVQAADTKPNAAMRLVSSVAATSVLFAALGSLATSM